MKKIHSFDEVYDSQKMFRLILSAISNPTRIVRINELSARLIGKEPELLAVAMTLLDNEASFNTCGNKELADEIVSLTLAKNENIQSADYIFVSKAEELGGAIEKAKYGTLRDPHRSATIIIKLDTGSGAALRLRGPGIEGSADLTAPGTVKSALELRDGRMFEYPQGIDFIFVTATGALFAVPRLVRMEAV